MAENSKKVGEDPSLPRCTNLRGEEEKDRSNSREEIGWGARIPL